MFLPAVSTAIAGLPRPSLVATTLTFENEDGGLFCLHSTLTVLQSTLRAGELALEILPLLLVVVVVVDVVSSPVDRLLPPLPVTFATEVELEAKLLSRPDVQVEVLAVAVEADDDRCDDEDSDVAGDVRAEADRTGGSLI